MRHFEQFSNIVITTYSWLIYIDRDVRVNKTGHQVKPNHLSWTLSRFAAQHLRCRTTLG